MPAAVSAPKASEERAPATTDVDMHGGSVAVDRSNNVSVDGVDNSGDAWLVLGLSILINLVIDAIVVVGLCFWFRRKQPSAILPESMGASEATEMYSARVLPAAEQARESHYADLSLKPREQGYTSFTTLAEQGEDVILAQ